VASPLNPEGQVREHLPLVFPVVPLWQSRAPTSAHSARGHRSRDATDAQDVPAFILSPGFRKQFTA
jgi:hypothetical protein